MLKNQMIRLNEDIKDCEYFKIPNSPCKRSKEANKIIHPIVHVPLNESQKILIVSQSPSKETDSKKVDENKESPAKFRCRIYSLVFFGKDNKRYMKIVTDNYEELKKTFSKYFYWIHYFKCYPGKSKSGDKSPNKICANKYLKKEIEFIEPELILTLGRLPKNYVSNLNLDCKIIHSLHPSGAARGYRKKYRFEETWEKYKKIFRDYFDEKDLKYIALLANNP